MSVFLAVKAIIDRLRADTGSGGLCKTGNPIVAPENITAFKGLVTAIKFPYIVVEARGENQDAMQSDDMRVSFTITVYDSAENGDSRIWPALRRIHGDKVLQSSGRPSYGLHGHLLVLSTDSTLNPLGLVGSDVILSSESFGPVDENVNAATIEGTVLLSRHA